MDKVLADWLAEQARRRAAQDAETLRWLAALTPEQRLARTERIDEDFGLRQGRAAKRQRRERIDREGQT